MLLVRKSFIKGRILWLCLKRREFTRGAQELGGWGCILHSRYIGTKISRLKTSVLFLVLQGVQSVLGRARRIRREGWRRSCNQAQVTAGLAATCTRGHFLRAVESP